jgi:hypothetical protein
MRAFMSLAALVTGSVLVSAAGPVKPVPSKPLTPIDAKAKGVTVVVLKNGNVWKPTEIATAEELSSSPLFNKDTATKLQKEVDFAKEKLVVFAWIGDRGDKIACELTTVYEKLFFAVFRHTPGEATKKSERFQIFVIPQDAHTITSSNDLLLDFDLPLEPLIAKEISTNGLKIVFPENPGEAALPEVFLTPAQVSKSTSLKNSANEIVEQLDFDKEKLVLVAWVGSSSDRFFIESNYVDATFILSFRVSPGRTVDLYKLEFPMSSGQRLAVVLVVRPFVLGWGNASDE